MTSAMLVDDNIATNVYDHSVNKMRLPLVLPTWLSTSIHSS